LKDVEGNNITLDRELQKERMFNPREQDGKDRVLDQKEREEEIERLNKEIIAIDTTATHEDMRFKDPNLIEWKRTENMILQQEFSKIEIDMNIAQSRIKELNGLRLMN
jgi:hypothetical protein